jgi:sugar lactone lactonase YvrE
LRDGSDAALAGAVEKIADTTMTDGMIADAAGNLYLTDMEHSAIVRVTPTGQLELVIEDPRLRWPDGFAWAPDGSLYVTASALHTFMPKLFVTEDLIAAGAPYHVFRIDL